jgi:DNA-binding NtrC family response regulator
MPAGTVQTGRNFDLPSSESIFGSSAGMREVREKIARAMEDDLPVLIEGESGTGKELIGRFLHKYSVRGDGPFVKFNCAAVPAVLVEGELFGYEKSAVVNMQETMVAGSIGLAWGGTLFLDEIHDLDLPMQLKLMGSLKSGQYRRVGGREDLALNGRFVCATSSDLEARVQDHTLLDGLLGCFVHHRLRLLPLRERREDIPRLCEYLLEKFARDFGRPVPHLDSNVLGAFQRWNWPGNVRELENWIARIVIFGADEVIGLEFNRQLAIGDQTELRYVRPPHTHFGRARRLRRHK